jgi:3-oxoacyl-[acyl-carrier protein] reductase
VAIVTGAQRNIGAAVARQLAADGAAVAVNHLDESGAAEGDALVTAITAAGGAAIRVQADVGDETAVAAMVEEVAERLGPADVLVNNAAAAATARRGPWHELSTAAWEEVLRTNVVGPFLCARAMRPAMLASEHAAIVSLSSVTVLLGQEGHLHYVTSKAALVGFTRALAREVGEDSIRVNAIMVGAIRTPAEDEAAPPEAIARRMAELQSLPRRGMPEDIATTASFLVSPAASFITGQTLTVDGGWVMH